MAEPSYIKKIYDDIGQLSTEQGQRFNRLEASVQEVKTGIGEIRKEFKEEIGSKIKDVKEAFENRIGPSEKSVHERFQALASQNKLVGAGILAVLVTLMLGFLTLVFKH